jgi:acetoin utilization deacetylase AcuC-like enzyme
VALDADTVMNHATARAALLAAGAAVRAVDEVCAGLVRRAFCATRPPGHHAERARPMGFCLFSNAVVAARHAQAAHGVARVVVCDFDVHHGNGTQDVVEDDPSIMFCSTHQMPLYPGTGAEGETGVGNVRNVALRRARAAKRSGRRGPGCCLRSGPSRPGSWSSRPAFGRPMRAKPACAAAG